MAKEKKTEYIRAAVTESLYNELVEYSEKKDSSISQVVRQAVREYMENHK